MPLFRSRPALDRVFVLSTGRCGSMTFARSLEHLTNWTSGHETLTRAYGDARFAYAERHVENDNRLSWMLGELGRRFDPERTLYVHLTRDPDQVAASFLRRWDSPTGIMRTFAHSVVQHSKPWPEEDRPGLAHFYIRTVTTNIEDFLEHRPRTAHVRLEHVATDIPNFLDIIGAEGDREAVMAAWQAPLNASAPTP